VCITVKDTGIGMDKSFVKNLFQKFTQEDESVTRRFGGTGLGMSICKQLIELLNGTIQVESEKGIGTTVTCILPFKKGTNAQLPKKVTEKLSSTILAGKKILVTDDNEMNRLVAATILKNYGAVIDEAQNGLEAFNKLNAQSFHLVLMDVQMPVMDGMEATKLIREKISKNLPIIALTALALKGDESKFLEAGMNDYLSKPFQENQLINVICSWLNKSFVEVENEFSSSGKHPLPDAKADDNTKGDEVFADKSIELFIQQAPELVKEITDAHSINDFVKVNRTAHQLRTSVNTVGIKSLKNVILEIELSNEEDQQSEAFGTLIAKLNCDVNLAIEELKLPQYQLK
ncbi:MAG TPA: response regulator, partial [Ginsengibacter sp.]